VAKIFIKTAPKIMTILDAVEIAKSKKPWTLIGGW
jgi:hypothetical protein